MRAARREHHRVVRVGARRLAMGLAGGRHRVALSASEAEGWEFLVEHAAGNDGNYRRV